MRIAIAVFDGAEELDFVGPWEVLSYWAGEVAQQPVEVVLAAATLDPVRAAKGLRVLPDVRFDDLGHVDVFVLPGGQGTRKLLGRNERLHLLLNELADSDALVTSVCTGSLVLAAAGLLRGRPATTYWSAFDELLAQDSTIDARPEERWVDDGNIVTAAGVSAGIDMALHLVVRLDSEDAARAVRKGIQYDPAPPV